MNLIAFTGSMGSGKSTVIELLGTMPGVKTHNVKFAEPLYDMQRFIYNRIRGAYAPPANFVKDRKLLQWLGTDWGRDTISKTLWVDIWKHAVKNISSLYPYQTITCDDARFDNEAQAVRDMGGILVRVVSDQNIVRINTANGIPNHTSEAGISEKYIDYTIENNGSLLELCKNVEKFVKWRESTLSGRIN